MSELRYVGKPAANVDGIDKAMGKAKYVGDLSLPGMLYARMLLSPVPHARIVRLNVEPALRVPGVLAAVTSENFADHGRYGWPKQDSWVLAHSKVRYAGDPIAAVAAETEEAARAGIAAIEVELEELPGVFDPAKALDADAPLVPSVPLVGEGNLVETLIVRNGDPAPILGECPIVIDQTYKCQHQEHAYLETEASLAVPHEDGSVTVYASTQSPFITQGNVAKTLGLPLDKVQIIQPPVGGSFGGKDDIGYSIGSQVAALALKTRRPVRMTLSREQSLLASYKREAMQSRIVLGATADGTLRAAQVSTIVDSGAYPSETSLATWRMAMHAAGAYRYEAVHVDADTVYTNNGYTGAFRGFGNTGATAMIEQAIDELAERLGRDPIDLRLQNCLRQGDRAMTGNVITHAVGLADCLAWVRERSDWDVKRVAYARQGDGDIRRGIGVACYFHGSSLGGEGADYATTTLTVESDCSISLTSGLTDYGQGSRTVFVLVAAEATGLAPSRFRVLRPDTRTAVESGPTVASRSSMLGGNASKIAGQALDRLLVQAAADALDCMPADITRAGEWYVDPRGKRLAFEEVVSHARAMKLDLRVAGTWNMPLIEWDFATGAGVPYYCYTFGAQVAEVQVDTRTGQTTVLGVWAAHDGGKVIFPQGAAGQMFGGIAQGLGYALMEQANYHDGYPQSLDLSGYLLPTARDVPEIASAFLETDFDEGPYGAKNLAEPVMIATAPAIANAIFQATGKRHRIIPMPLEQILLGHPLTPSGAVSVSRQTAGFGDGKGWRPDGARQKTAERTA